MLIARLPHAVVMKESNMSKPTVMNSKTNRRRFLAMAGLTGASAAGLAGTSFASYHATVNGVTNVAGYVAPTPTPEMDHTSMSGSTSTPATPASSGTPTADDMDAMHEAGIKSFPAATAGLGGQPLAHTLDGAVKVFELEASAISWEYAPGQFADAYAYNGVVPGPEIRVTEGDQVRISLTNKLPESTAIHWHGVMLPNSMDGVPFMTQPPVKPGETFTYEFTARAGNAGSHMYHSHHNSAEQVTKGLLGAFIIEPSDPASRPAFDREYTIILNDGPIGGFTLNGKSFPATQPLHAKQGERLLIRYMNEGLMIHPMHLHGMPMTVIAQDGYLAPQPHMCDTLNIAPGQRWEVLVDATEVGIWAFHCHILSHAESSHGMFGMVTALIVEP
jgi:FtsP/CotA-like multicopper oxidase with cupredoxin domain